MQMQPLWMDTFWRRIWTYFILGNVQYNPSRNRELYLKLCHTDNTNTVTCHDDAQVRCRDEQRVGNVTAHILICHVLVQCVQIYLFGRCKCCLWFLQWLLYYSRIWQMLRELWNPMLQFDWFAYCFNASTLTHCHDCILWDLHEVITILKHSLLTLQLKIVAILNLNIEIPCTLLLDIVITITL